MCLSPSMKCSMMLNQYISIVYRVFNLMFKVCARVRGVFSDYRKTKNIMDCLLKNRNRNTIVHRLFALTTCYSTTWLHCETFLWNTWGKLLGKIDLVKVELVGGMQKNKSLRFSLQMIGSLHCNLRDNREQEQCIMHYNHRQEEGWVKRGLANVVICFVQSLQLGCFIWCSWRERGMKKLEECRWITAQNTQETLK